MSVLNPTQAALLCDVQDRPYFLWDCDLTLSEFRALLNDPDPTIRAYAIAKLMRQAKPDDVFSFVGLREIEEHWAVIAPQLGHQRDFWTWLLRCWGAVADAA